MDLTTHENERNEAITHENERNETRRNEAITHDTNESPTHENERIPTHERTTIMPNLTNTHVADLRKGDIVRTWSRTKQCYYELPLRDNVRPSAHNNRFFIPVTHEGRNVGWYADGLTPVKARVAQR